MTPRDIPPDSELDAVVGDERSATDVINRREALQRVGVLLGGLTLVGGSGLLTACERERPVLPAAAPPARQDPRRP